MIQKKILPNGMVILVETIPHLKSAAFDLSFPGGIITDPEGREGSCLILAELTSRGAAGKDSRELLELFDYNGIRHSEGAGFNRFHYRGTLLSEKLPVALGLVKDMVREPNLSEDEIDNIRSLFLQDLISLQDNPARLAMIELSKRCKKAPFSRTSYGTQEGLEATTHADLKAMWEQAYQPGHAILSVAGSVEPEEIFELTEKLFGDWGGDGISLPEFTSFQPPGNYHTDYDSAQEQIALAYPSVSFLGEHYYTAKVANGLLSGGMFGRLFIEVREKRGLCYSVYSSHSSNNDYGMCTAYAGTTPERAHETLEVMLSVLKDLKGTVEEEEFERAKTNILSSIIMSEESAGARAVSNSGDWFLRQDIRTLDTIKEAIQAVTIKDIDEYIEMYPVDNHTLVTLGKRALTTTA